MTQLRIQRSFQRGLHSYHLAATPQAAFAEKLASILATHAPKQLGPAFEFGCGTGHLTNALNARFRFEALILNDLVPECEHFAHMADQFLPGPIEGIQLPQSLALIASASTVQWINDLPGLINRLWLHLAPGGWLALSGFGPNHFHELMSLGSQASAPGYTGTEALSAMLPENAQVVHLSEETLAMGFDTAQSLLRHLRETGVNGQAKGGWSRTRLKRFEDQYFQEFGKDGQLPLTYSPVYMIARKPLEAHSMRKTLQEPR